MEKEFVPYEQSLALKELGFDQKCISVYLTSNKRAYPMYRPYTINEQTDELLRPLWQQAFKWFREEYKYSSFIKEATKGKYRFYIEKFDEKYYNSEILSYEDAELGCLKKLIEIVKNKENKQ
jgi:hypothetical protein